MMLIPTLQKELLLLRRDPRALVRLIVLPLIFIGLFGYLFKTTDAKEKPAQPVAVWNGGGPAGEAMIRALDESKLFTASAQPSAEAAEHAVATHQVAVAPFPQRSTRRTATPRRCGSTRRSRRSARVRCAAR
jgi:ABC-type Na+ efflux pump permease subunit